jgi:hypothetical protein
MIVPRRDALTGNTLTYGVIPAQAGTQRLRTRRQQSPGPDFRRDDAKWGSANV